MAAAVALSARAGGARSCTFHCNTSVCGGPVSIIPWTLPHTLFFQPPSPVVTAIDLRSRKITAVADGAFSCWPHRFLEGPTAVLLDGNPLKGIPDGDAFGGRMLVSLRDCEIAGSPEAEEYQAFAGGIPRCAPLLLNPLIRPPAVFAASFARCCSSDQVCCQIVVRAVTEKPACQHGGGANRVRRWR